MNEDSVKDITKKWLRSLPNVANVLGEQLIITEGLTTDFIAFNEAGEIVYIAECKGSVDIGELAKGIGQAYQYNYQKNLNPRSKGAEVLLVVPKEIAGHFNSLLVPEEIKVFFVNSDGKIFERVRRKIGKPTIELQLPKTFYIRDIELNHIKYLINLIHKMSIPRKGKVSAEDLMKKIEKEQPKIPARGYNHFITLRALGVMGVNNTLTPLGYRVLGLIEKSEEAFKREMCDYFYCFLINVLNALVLIAIEKRHALNNIECTHQEIANKICEEWGQTVRFMYDPRTVSTAIRMLIALKAIKKISKGKYKLIRFVHPHYLPWGRPQKRLPIR